MPGESPQRVWIYLGCSSRAKNFKHANRPAGGSISLRIQEGGDSNGLQRRPGYAPEGAKRRYPAHFTSKLTDADGELQETRHWLSRAQAYGYIDQQTLARLDSDCQRIGRRLGAMLKSGNWT